MGAHVGHFGGGWGLNSLQHAEMVAVRWVSLSGDRLRYLPLAACSGCV